MIGWILGFFILSGCKDPTISQVEIDQKPNMQMIESLHKEWNDFFDQGGPSDLYLHLTEDLGASEVRNALMCYDKNRKHRIITVHLSPNAYVERKYCYSSRIYATIINFKELRLNDQERIRRKQFIKREIRNYLNLVKKSSSA